MSRISRLDTVVITLRTGLIPVLSGTEVATAIALLEAFATGGVRVVEYTNRGDGAIDTFAALERHCREHRPDVVLGIGSVLDAGTAAQFLNVGAAFVVSPSLVDEVATVCNRRMVAYMPGAATPGEVMRAAERGAEIVKVFPARSVAPSFVSDVLAPCPWVRLMPTGGISPVRESMAPWLEAGSACLGLGSQLAPPSDVAAGRWSAISERCRAGLQLVAELRRPLVEEWAAPGVAVGSPP